MMRSCGFLVKDASVNLENLHPFSRDAAKIACEEIQLWTGFENVITSGNDGKHSDHSFHYKDRATDHRTWVDETSGVQIYQPTKESIANEIRKRLNVKYANVAHFDVIAEATHIHVELDTIYETE